MTGTLVLVAVGLLLMLCPAGVLASDRKPRRAAAPAPVAAAEIRETEILPIDRIRPGMRGYGISDMGDGKGIQRFDVEIIGVLKRYAPRQDLVLARVSGAGLEKSGIIAGMSGSPIYVED
ncbi:MAG TPA: hypothetical protein VKH43_06250, partial [Thermoanaerobaculia bacterium]|nr:hypothetical protein [Thermoanaerobaculia bacterium]